ncbi:MAG: YqeG family HAD IIIA-type phosphatase [bacterium]
MLRLKPTYIIDNVIEMDLNDLKDEGIKGLIFDLDNTLMEPHSGKLREDIKLWLEEVREDFKIAVLSNNPHEEYVEEAVKLINCVGYAKADKPRRKTAIKLLKELELLPSETAMIGDRPLTDIWVGQKLGMTTILVDPLIKNDESKFIQLLRKLERVFIKPAHKKFNAKNN